MGVRYLKHLKHLRRPLLSYTNLYTSPYAKTQGQWIARCIVQGFFTAPIEALPEITVTDVVGISSVPPATR